VYPCCIIVALLLLHLWGARDKIKVLLRRGKRRARRGEQTPSLKEELRQTTYIEKKDGGYSDGRTRVIHL
jgi:hypothetical protein